MGRIRKTKLKRQMISQKTKGKTCAVDSSDAQGEQQSLNSLDWTSETGLDFSRRSSLKTSILDIGLSRSGSSGPNFTENALTSITKQDSSKRRKPEVIVTKVIKTRKTPISSHREPEERMMAYMNLLPAPTLARFVGKMQENKIEIDSLLEFFYSSNKRKNN
jgi:hypothetical protein